MTLIREIDIFFGKCQTNKVLKKYIICFYESKRMKTFS